MSILKSGAKSKKELKSKPPKKKIEPIDPLQITEDLGIQTFRRGCRKPWSKDEDALLLRLVEESLSIHGIYINKQTDSLQTPPSSSSSSSSSAKSNQHTSSNQLDSSKVVGKFVYTSQLPTNVTSYNDLISWDQIASQIALRKPKDCRKRWSNSLDPNLKKGRWTKTEDELLLNAFKKYGPSWQKVALEIPGRTDDQCAKRYIEVLDPSMTHNRLRNWDTSEDLMLIGLVKQHGTRWRTVSFGMKSRPSLTCRNRWRKIITDVTRGKAHPQVSQAVQAMKEFVDATSKPSNKNNSFKLDFATNSNISSSAPSTPTTVTSKRPTKSKLRTKSVSSTPSVATPPLSKRLLLLNSTGAYTLPQNSNSSHSTTTTTPITLLSRTFEKAIITDDCRSVPLYSGRMVPSRDGMYLGGLATSSSIHNEAEKALVGLQTSVDDDTNPRSHSSTFSDPLQSPVVLTEENMNDAISGSMLSNDFLLSNSQFPAVTDDKPFNYKPITTPITDKRQLPGTVVVNGKSVLLSDLFGNQFGNEGDFDASKTSVSEFFNKCADFGLKLSVMNDTANNISNNSSSAKNHVQDINYLRLRQLAGKLLSSKGTQKQSPGLSLTSKLLVSQYPDIETDNNVLYNLNARKHQKQASAGTLGISKRPSLTSTPSANSRRKSVSSVSSATSSKFSKSPKSGLNSSRSNVNSVNTTPRTGENSANIHRSALINKKAAYEPEEAEEGIDFWDNIRYLKPTAPQSSNTMTNQSHQQHAMNNINPNTFSSTPQFMDYNDSSQMNNLSGSQSNVGFQQQFHQNTQLSFMTNPTDVAKDISNAPVSSASSQHTIQQIPVSEHHPLHYEPAPNSFADPNNYGIFYSDYPYETELDIDEQSPFGLLPFNPS